MLGSCINGLRREVSERPWGMLHREARPCMSNLWRCLEDLPGLVALPVAWRNRLEGNFDAVRTAFLRSRSGRGESFPCERCGCAHEVVEHKGGALVAVCRCEPWNCDD